MITIVIDCPDQTVATAAFKHYEYQESVQNVRIIVLNGYNQSIPRWMNYTHLHKLSTDLKEKHVHVRDIHYCSYAIKFDILIRSTEDIVDIPSASRRDTTCGDAVACVEIVVAKYKEDIGWLELFFKSCHVYDKGGETFPAYDVWRWESVPNIGRESHTYLYHIINNYNCLCDVTLFTQGLVMDHGLTVSDVIQTINHAESNGFKQCHVMSDLYSNWGRMNHSGKWLSELKSGHMRKASTTFGEFYNHVIGADHPAFITIYYAAIFTVRRDVIQQKSIEYYIDIIRYVNDHVNPEEGHYFERIWFTLWSTLASKIDHTTESST